MSGRWHPILAAVEGARPVRGGYSTASATSTDALNCDVNGGADARYKAYLRGDHIGWATTLRTACERIHAAYLLQHGPGGGAIADWGELTGHGRRD